MTLSSVLYFSPVLGAFFYKKMKKILFFLMSLAYANNVIGEQFESLFVNGGDKLNSLSYKYPAGKYYVDIFLNQNRVKRAYFVIDKNDEIRGEMCFSQSMLSDLGIRVDFLKYQHTYNENCGYVLASDPYTKMHFDSSSMQLHFEIPDAYLMPFADSNTWDYGVGGAHINYNFSLAKTERQRMGGFLHLDSHFNLGHFVLSNNMNISKDNRGMVDFDTRDTVLSTAIKSIESDLSMGRLMTDSTLLSGFNFQGVMLKSNDRMKSRGYAPDITGIAHSMSKISVSQNGITIFSKFVPPGPYKITELPSIGGGDLLVTTTDSDGSIDEKIYPVAVLPSLIRNGEFDFLVSLGKKDNLSNLFILGEIGYGFHNVTINSASILHDKYFITSSSITASLGDIGAISPSLYFSSAKHDESRKRGSSYSLKYAKQFAYGPNLELSTYRYKTRGYVEFSNFNNENVFFSNVTNEKSRYEGVLSNKFGQVHASASIWLKDYWGGTQKSTGISINAGTPIFNKRAFASFFGNYSGSTSSTRIAKENQFSLGVNISIPLDDYGLSTQHSVSYSNGQGMFSSGVSSFVNDRFNYNASVSGGINKAGNSANASFNYTFDQMNTGVSVSQSNNGYALSSRASGAIILTNETGLVFSNVSSNTIGITEIKSDNEPSKRKIKVTPLNSYVKNNLTVNLDDVDNDIELLNTSYDLSPTEKSIIYREFNANKIYRYVLKVRDAYGNYAMDGSALSDTGEHLGEVNARGVLFFETTTNNLNKITIQRKMKTCLINLSGINKKSNKMQEVICE